MIVSNRKLKSVRITGRHAKIIFKLDADIKKKIDQMTESEKAVLRDRIRGALNLHKRCP